MNRIDLHRLANARLAEANALFIAGHPSGAYYLAGYTVECALKAVIALTTQQHDFPDKKRANDSHVHDLKKLIEVAKLATDLDIMRRQNEDFSENWRVVTEWSEASRYAFYDDAKARFMLHAVGSEPKGVLRWITRFW